MAVDARISLEESIKKHPLVKNDEKILVLGAKGQVAGYLVPELRKYYPNNLLLTDVGLTQKHKDAGLTELDVTDTAAIRDIIVKNNVKVVINLAALLSAGAEKNPELAHRINVEAPRNLLQIARDSWDTASPIRQVFMPSSIAAINAPKGERAVVGAKKAASGNYGLAKYETEEAFMRYNAEAQARSIDSSARCLRYGGVLACHVPPSPGTTEELDKMIIAAAYHKARGGSMPKLASYYKDGVYCPELPAEATFPMMDGKTVGLETLRFMHTPAVQLKNEAARYHLAEWNMNVGELQGLLQTIAPDFKVAFDERRYNADKVRFSQEWPTNLDMTSSVDDWGFARNRETKPTKSVRDHFDRLVTHFKREAMQGMNCTPPQDGVGSSLSL